MLKYFCLFCGAFLLLAVCSSASATPAVSGAVDRPATLVKDINTNTQDSLPGEFTVIGNNAYFRADDGVHGSELWKTDGSNTTLVADINPGAASSSPSLLTEVDGVLFFRTYDVGLQLWRSDGTAAGTFPIYANVPALQNVFVEVLESVGESLFFVGYQNGNSALWKTDGTAAGTLLLKPNFSLPWTLAKVGDRLFFLVGAALWVSDGTLAGTQRVKNFTSDDTASAAATRLAEGPSSAPPFRPPSGFTDINGTLFFSANDGQGKRGLWKSDGTEAGTVLVYDVGESGGLPINLTRVNDELFFELASGLWKSDGTPGGAVQIKAKATFVSYISQLLAVDSTLYILFGPASGACELWRSNGTSANTVLVKRFTTPAPTTSCGLFTSRGGTLMLSFGETLWKSDGTAAGTALVANILPFWGMVNLPSALLFAATDIAHGTELWRSDMTPAGTGLLQDINAVSADSNSINRIELNGLLYFSANDGAHGAELWRSDGTPAGTTLVKDINPGPASADPFWLVAIDGILYFSADDGVHGAELWRSDGSATGTVLLKDLVPGAGSSAPGSYIRQGSSFFFFAGSALWKSNGTAAGTTLVKADLPDAGSPAIIQGALIFVSNGILWRSDGTPAGTTVLKATRIRGPLASFNNMLFFANEDDAYGTELWTSDGTPAGTTLLKDIVAGTIGSYPASLIPIGSTLFFTVMQPDSGGELWKSDGTAAGTVLVKKIIAAGATNLAGTLVFVADDGIHGSELWRSDGSAAGTSIIKELIPGADDADPGRLTNINGTLLFAATDASGTQGLWRSDGSAQGTRLVQPLTLGPNGSFDFTTNFVRAGSKVFFRAWDAQAGYELWAMPAQPGIATTLQATSLNAAPPGGIAPLSLQYLNSGLTTPQAITLTATLGPGLVYIGQTSPVSPTLNGNTLTWRLPGVGYLDAGQVLLRVQAPTAAYGTRYPIDLRLAADGAAPSSARIEVMVAHLAYLPTIRR